MNVIRVWRDGTETFTLQVHDGTSLKAIYATHSEISRQLDSCGSTHDETIYSIRIVGTKTFVEHWTANSTYKGNRDKVGFRKTVPYEMANNAYCKLSDAIRALHSDSDDVVEVFEMLKSFVEDLEGGNDEKEGR